MTMNEKTKMLVRIARALPKLAEARAKAEAEVHAYVARYGSTRSPAHLRRAKAYVAADARYCRAWNLTGRIAGDCWDGGKINLPA
jgi:hypothetical protein